MVLRLPRFLGITEQRLARTESWFARRGDGTVLLARLVPGVRTVVSIPAGTLRMPMGRFLLSTAVGSLAWNSGLIALGTALATSWQTVLGAVVSSVSTYAVAAIAGVGLLLALRRTHPIAARP
jgi:membrane protein DedA with SNARE-associated domain